MVAFATNITESPYNAVGDGDTDNGPIFQQAINDAVASGFTGGPILIPPGNYFDRGSTVRGGVRLLGAGRNVTTLQCKTEDRTVLAFEEGANYPGAQDMTVFGYNSAAAGEPVVSIQNNVPVNLLRMNIGLGATGLLTYGVDGSVRDCVINAYKRGVLSYGSSSYFRCKLDNDGYPAGGQYAFAQGATANGRSQNQLVDVDMSGTFANSLLVNDAGQHGAVLELSVCTLGRPFLIQSAKFISMTGCLVTGGTNEDSNCHVMLVNCVGDGAVIYGPNVSLLNCSGVSRG